MRTTHVCWVAIYSLLSLSAPSGAEPPELRSPGAQDLSQFIYREDNQAFIDVNRLRLVIFPPFKVAGNLKTQTAVRSFAGNGVTVL